MTPRWLQLGTCYARNPDGRPCYAPATERLALGGEWHHVCAAHGRQLRGWLERPNRETDDGGGC